MLESVTVSVLLEETIEDQIKNAGTIRAYAEEMIELPHCSFRFCKHAPKVATRPPYVHSFVPSLPIIRSESIGST